MKIIEISNIKFCHTALHCVDITDTPARDHDVMDYLKLRNAKQI